MAEWYRRFQARSQVYSRRCRERTLHLRGFCHSNPELATSVQGIGLHTASGATVISGDRLQLVRSHLWGRLKHNS